MAVQMRGMNSETYGAFDLGADFTLGFLGLEVVDRRNVSGQRYPEDRRDSEPCPWIPRTPTGMFSTRWSGPSASPGRIGMCFRVGRDLVSQGPGTMMLAEVTAFFSSASSWRHPRSARWPDRRHEHQEL